MAAGFLPPSAPGGEEPARWEARRPPGEDHARMVVATASREPQLVRAAEHPPRNGHAIASLGVGLASLGLLVVSVGLSCLVSLACSLIALGLGRRGRRRAQGEGIGGWRAARWGIALAVVGCVLSLVALAAWILVFALDIDLGTDFGRPGPTAPTEFSALAILVREHL